MRGLRSSLPRPVALAILAGLCLGIPRLSVASGASGTFEDLAVEWLSGYIRVDTTNPPGNELQGALFLKRILEGEGIPVEIDEFQPGRANLLATLKGSGRKRPLLLASHMDVVPADAAHWSSPPFDARIQGGTLYGRGAVDMKSEGILQLATLVRLKREGVPLDRDVMFLATADEEVDFAGADRAASPEGWGERLRACEFGIAEGGENRRAEDGRPEHFGIQTAQKATYWLRLSTTGTPGHGSQPAPDSAVDRLVRALDRIRTHATKVKVLPSVEKELRALSDRVASPEREWYRDISLALRDPRTLISLERSDPDVAALLRNTIAITVVKAGYKTNVIPEGAEAELDVRLLPGERPQDFLAELREVISDESVSMTFIESRFREGIEVSTETELYRAIESTLRRRFPGVPVMPTMSTGATENAVYRKLGILSYGFTPLLLTKGEDASEHADDERLSLATFRESIDVLYDVVSTVVRK